MKAFFTACAMSIAISAAAYAALPVGATAPAFSTEAALGGKEAAFTLSAALKKGPVVLYFFPAAFTSGCTLEAHDFAEASAKFHALGATVIGVTAGNVDRVAEFSKVECRSKFAVAADPKAKIAAKYDVQKVYNGNLLSNRTSYVIAPDGKILLSYTNDDPDQHVAKTMAAVKAWQDHH